MPILFRLNACSLYATSCNSFELIVSSKLSVCVTRSNAQGRGAIVPQLIPCTNMTGQMRQSRWAQWSDFTVAVTHIMCSCLYYSFHPHVLVHMGVV